MVTVLLRVIVPLFAFTTTPLAPIVKVPDEALLSVHPGDSKSNPPTLLEPLTEGWLAVSGPANTATSLLVGIAVFQLPRVSHAVLLAPVQTLGLGVALVSAEGKLSTPATVDVTM